MVMFVRVVILYILVVVVMRIMGKRQIGELQPFELVIAIMLSEIAAVPMQDTGIPLMHGVIPILTLVFLQIIISYATLKHRGFRKLVCGTPSILIEHGKVIENELARQRFDLDDLMEELRMMGYLDISDVEYAILETSGKVSIVPKFEKSPLSREDLKIQGKEPSLPIGIILDGKLAPKNLQLLGYDNEWLNNQLSELNINNIDDVFVAIMDSSGKLFIQRRGEENEK
jgi:uncharacterized membrane protein YcaP (DUF421 family)